MPSKPEKSKNPTSDSSASGTQAYRSRKAAGSGVEGASRKSKAADNGSNTGMDTDAIRKALLELRERVDGQISFLSDDANHKDDTPTDDRTDDFDREFAFNLVSTEQDALYEIDSALRRLDQQVYGRCECCEGSIEKNRLEALPFARNCLSCQADFERGTTRGRTSIRSASEIQDSHHFEDTDTTESE